MDIRILSIAIFSNNLQKELCNKKKSGHKAVVQPDQIPSDVITLNSTVRLLDQKTDEEMLYTLVFPEQANISQGKISILAPIGTAMLGYKAGDTFEWDTPGGTRIILVKEILYQPEASGDEQ